MNIIFCVDRKAPPGLHVAAYSLLARISPAILQAGFSVFSDALDEFDPSCCARRLSM
jgi:hypothetical protein